MQEQDISFKIGDIVWAKLRGHPWWPAKVRKQSLLLFPNTDMEINHLDKDLQKSNWCLLYRSEKWKLSGPSTTPNSQSSSLETPLTQ